MDVYIYKYLTLCKYILNTYLPLDKQLNRKIMTVTNRDEQTPRVVTWESRFL